MKNILFLFLATLIISCGTSKRAAVYAPRLEQSDVLVASTDNNYEYLDQQKSERKIISAANLTLIVTDPDSTNQKLERIATKYKGYVNELGTSQTIIRVKSENMDKAIDEISLLGKVQNKNLTGHDVTNEFLDFQIRLDNAQKARARYLELLKKAENVEAALKVEKELERLNETIDLIKGRMNRINHLSAFATIRINLKEKKKLGLIGYIGKGVYHAVKWLFVRN